MSNTDDTAGRKRTIVICQLCRKRVYQVRNGEWYHDRNSSAFCNPGGGRGQKAVPLEIEARRPDQHRTN